MILPSHSRAFRRRLPFLRACRQAEIRTGWRAVGLNMPPETTRSYTSSDTRAVLKPRRPKYHRDAAGIQAPWPTTTHFRELMLTKLFTFVICLKLARTGLSLLGIRRQSQESGDRYSKISTSSRPNVGWFSAGFWPFMREEDPSCKAERKSRTL